MTENIKLKHILMQTHPHRTVQSRKRERGKEGGRVTIKYFALKCSVDVILNKETNSLLSAPNDPTKHEACLHCSRLNAKEATVCGTPVMALVGVLYIRFSLSAIMKLVL